MIELSLINESFPAREVLNEIGIPGRIEIFPERRITYDDGIYTV